jgi:hypothetical protein
MAVSATARKLTNRKRYFHLLLTTSSIERAVRNLERRFGRGFVNLHADLMSPYEREWVAEAIIQVGLARRLLGLPPFCPIEPDDDLEGTSLPLPFLTPEECSALVALFNAEESLP